MLQHRRQTRETREKESVAVEQVRRSVSSTRLPLLLRRIEACARSQYSPSSLTARVATVTHSLPHRSRSRSHTGAQIPLFHIHSWILLHSTLVDSFIELAETMKVNYSSTRALPRWRPTLLFSSLSRSFVFLHHSVRSTIIVHLLAFFGFRLLPSFSAASSFRC